MPSISGCIAAGSAFSIFSVQGRYIDRQSVQRASLRVLAEGEGGIFVTVTCVTIVATPWESRLQPVAIKLRDARYSAVEIYRLTT